ncbi:MAG: RNA pyrophosphohydrolase [Porticoccaceae bacterium]|nr:RNA pyrophosphohydrolase [Porticoccaceae bacterium]
MLDKEGFRSNIAIVLSDGYGKVFWAKRVGQAAWQFPQGGVDSHESPEQALYRELHEEIGLRPGDVSIIQSTRRWLRYKIPVAMQRKSQKPVCIGQKQKWYFLRLEAPIAKVRFDTTDAPEFDDWQWVNYWHPIDAVVAFKRGVYRAALKEFSGHNQRLQLMHCDTGQSLC